MAAHIKKAIYPATVIASDTTTVGEAFGIHAHAEGGYLVSTVSSRSDGTFTTTLQHSRDGVNWTNVLDDENAALATAAQSGDGTVYKQLISTAVLFPYVRASILSASTTSGATVTVEFWHGVQR